MNFLESYIKQRKNFIGFPNPRRGLKKRGEAEFFSTNFEVFGNRMKVFRVFDIASQTINNSWRNSKRTFTKFYDNLDHICQNAFTVMIFFLFHELLMREKEI